jgi:hypothetical protein
LNGSLFRGDSEESVGNTETGSVDRDAEGEFDGKKQNKCFAFGNVEKNGRKKSKKQYEKASSKQKLIIPNEFATENFEVCDEFSFRFKFDPEFKLFVAR